MTEANPTTEPTIESTPKEPERTFTQADIDAAINARLKDERKKHADELAKFSDYEDLKDKAAKLDEIEAANKSEAEKAAEALSAAIKRADEAEAKVASLQAQAEHGALVARIALEENVPSHLLNGADEDELRASAQALKAWQESAKPPVPQDKGGAVTPPAETLESIKAMPGGPEKMQALARYHASQR